MNIADISKKLKQILRDSNVALIEKGGSECNTLSELSSEINNLEINKLPYLLRDEIFELTEDDFGEGIIRDNAFTYTSRWTGNNLTTVVIPDTVTEIGNSAFDSCDNLTNVVIGSGIISIGENAFMSCFNLQNIYIRSITPPTLKNINAFSYTNPIIHVPIGSGNAYQTTTNWSEYADIIVEDIVIE